MGEERKHNALQLPTQLGDRVLLAVMAVPVALLSGFSLLGLLTVGAGSSTPMASIRHFILSELAGSVFIISASALVWAFGRPASLERFLRRSAGWVAFVVLAVSTSGLVWGVLVLFKYWWP